MYTKHYFVHVELNIIPGLNYKTRKNVMSEAIFITNIINISDESKYRYR